MNFHGESLLVIKYAAKAHMLIDEYWILYLWIYSNNPGCIQSN